MQTATTKYKTVGAGVVWGWVGYLSPRQGAFMVARFQVRDTNRNP